jgi:serine/threonine-protein kinase HipA
VSEKRLVISLPGRIVGVLLQSRQGVTTWVPDDAWEHEGQEPRLGLDFLRKRGRRLHASDLPAWFENLLPERESKLRWRLAAAFGLREGQSFDLLRVLGHDLTGAVEARGHAGADIETPGAEILEEPRTVGTPGTWVRLSALAGLQLKFSMSMVNDRLTLSARSNGAQWIVKLAGPEYEELAEVEAATMTWAKLAGFDVPPHRVVPFDRLDGIPPGWAEGAAPAFAVRRFDRREDGSKIHQEDLCQALDLRPRNKFGDEAPRVTFEGALRVVQDVCGESGAREMARRIGFMIASGNTDAHLKNWGLLWGDKLRPTLAPCYDLVATIAWSRLGWERTRGPELALRLGGERYFARLTEGVLQHSASRLGHSWGRDEIVEGIDRARDAWAGAVTSAPVRMRTAIERHWESVPLLASRGLRPL